MVPPDGSAHLSEVNVFAWPAVVASATLYVPSASPEIVLELPDVRSWNACPPPEYDHATPAGAGSVCKRITIEPPPAAPAAETPTPGPTARTERENLTRPQFAQRQRRNRAPIHRGAGQHAVRGARNPCDRRLLAGGSRPGQCSGMILST